MTRKDQMTRNQECFTAAWRRLVPSHDARLVGRAVDDCSA